ncbi:MAG: GreA/GreB family elongation factor [Brevinemataceae bacterium]
MAEKFSNKKEEFLADIQQKLNEEKWTNTPLDTYSVRSFVELDSIIETASNNDFLEDLRLLCKDHLKEASHSVSALYIVGAISLQESAMDDSYLPLLIKTFLEINKNKIVQFLCEKILSYREHKYALRTLEQIYKEDNDQDALFAVKKRLVLIDSSDAANAKFLGEFYENEDTDLAMFYYRLAIERFISMRNLKMIEEIWNRIIALYPEDTKLIIVIAKKIREAADDEYVASLVFTHVAKNLIKEEKFKLVLPIIKFCVSLHPSEKAYRKALEDCYREIYKDHNQLEHYLKTSAVGQSWKPYREAIRFFETHIAFDQGSFVYHKSWGIGQVKLIEKERVIVSFDNKQDHEMTLKIALRALTVFDDNHILLWKSQKTEELKEKLNSDPLFVIELIMKSKDAEEINSKELKDTVVPEMLTEKEWGRWWLRAKKLMETSNTIVPSLVKRNIIEFRDKEYSLVEELISRFKKTTSFDNKISVALNFIDRGGDINAPIAKALREYFIEILETPSELAEKKLHSLILLKFAKAEGMDSFFSDSSLLNGIKNLIDFYQSLDSALQKILLLYIQKQEGWPDIYTNIMLRTPLTKNHNYMLQELVSHDKWENLNSLFSFALNNFQEKSEFFVWSARCVLEDMKDELGDAIKNEELALRMLTLLDIINSEIGVKTFVGRNKKLLNQIEDFLFKKNLLQIVIDDADETTAQSVFALLSSIITLDKGIKESYLTQLNHRFPKLKTAAPKTTIIKTRHPFLVTKQSYENKRRELEDLVNREIPANSLAIGEAMEKGDLRENAEYKAALEKQDQLKASLVKLENDLAQAKIIEKDKVDLNKVDVGVKVTLEEEKDGVVVFQILDPWAVNFDKGIISYHSPLGHALLDKKVNDKIKFEFNGEVKNFKVLNIELADFE